MGIQFWRRCGANLRKTMYFTIWCFPVFSVETKLNVCFPHFLDDSTVILEEHAFPRLVFHTFLNKAAGKVPDIRWYAIAQFVNRCLSKQFKWISKIWDFVHFVLNVFSQIMLEYDHYSFKIKLVNNANPRAGIIGVGDQCNFPIILPRSGQKFKNESITL